MKKNSKANLFYYNGSGTNPHEIKLTLSPKDRMSFNALSKERWAEDDSVVVTDLPTGKCWRVRRANCGAGCYCAAEAVPESSVTVTLNDRELATVLAALRNLQVDLMQPEFRNSWKDSEHFQDCKPLSSDQIDTLCARINHG